MSIQISASVFNQAIPTPLTNEIPHLSIYDLLNKQIRMDWSREIIGKSIVHYERRNSIKMVEGVQSTNYTGREDVVITPDGQEILLRRDKIDFEITGFLETEIDYLMHENTRYLLKLFPDDVNSLVTLTEAERQSYFNEALHLIHSYFDTEQIIDSESEINTFYFRHKFLEQITPIRKITGVIYQERNLMNLLNPGDINFYSGYKVYMGELGDNVFSFGEDNISQKGVNAFEFSFESDTQVRKSFQTRVAAYFTEENNFSNFLEDFSEKNSLSLAELQKFKKINYSSVNDIVKSMILGKDELQGDDSNSVFQNLDDNCVNTWIYQAVKARLLSQETTLESLASSSLAENRIFTRGVESTPVSFVYSNGSENLVPISGKIFKKQDLLDYRNSYFLTSDVLKDIKDTYILRTGEINFNENLRLALGNLIMSHFQLVLKINEKFRETITTAAYNKNFHLTISLKRDLKRVFDLASVLAPEKEIIPGATGFYTQQGEPISIHNDGSFWNAYGVYDGELYVYGEEKPQEVQEWESMLAETEKELAKMELNNIPTFSMYPPEGYELKETDDWWEILDHKTGLPIESNWRLYLDKRNDNYLDVSLSTLTKMAWMAEKAFQSKKYRIAKTCLDFCLSHKDQPFQKEIFYIIFSKAFLKGLDLDNLPTPTLTAPFYDGYDLSIIADSVMSLEELSESSFDITANSYATFYGEGLKTNSDGTLPEFGEYFEYKDIFSSRIKSEPDSFESMITESADRKISENTFIVNYLEIPVDGIYELYPILKENLEMRFDEYYDEVSQLYTYANAYQIKTGNISEGAQFVSEAIEKSLLSKLLFLPTQISTDLNLTSVPCYFEREDLVKTEVLPDGLQLNTCKIPGFVLSNYGIVLPVSINKIYKEGNYYYFQDDLAKDLCLYDNRNGYLYIPKKYLSDMENVYLESDSEEDTAEKRKIVENKVYKQDQNYIFYKTWETLQKKHLNYSLLNLQYDFPSVFDSNSILGQNTLSPSVLYLNGEMTVVDLPTENRAERFKLLKELVAENKSLYLDSTLKLLNQAALQVNNLVYTDNYGDLAYMIKDGIPSEITFYQKPVEDVDIPEFRNVKDFIDNSKGKELSIEELEKQFGRRRIIWGNVIWDANDTTRTIAVLRTIWSSYFANFEIYSSVDLIPSEPALLSLDGDLKGANLQVYNYNYSANNGDPSLAWELAVSANPLGKNSVIVTGIDSWTHKPVVDAMDEPIDFSKLRIFPLDFHINLSEPTSKDILEKMEANFYLEEFLPGNKKITFQILNDLKIIFDKWTFTYTGKLGQKEYTFNLIFNQFYNTEKFDSVGIFRTALNDKPFEMILEYLLVEYYKNRLIPSVLSSVETTKNPYYEKLLKTVDEQTAKESFERIKTSLLAGLFSAEGLTAFASISKEKKLSITLEEILDYWVEERDQTVLPIAVCAEQDGKAKCYYLRVEKSEDGYKLIGGTFLEAFTADLVDSFSNYDDFPVEETQKSAFSNSISKNIKYMETSNFSADFLNVDLYLTKDIDDNEWILDEELKYNYKIVDGQKINHDIWYKGNKGEWEDVNGNKFYHDNLEVKNYFTDLYSKTTEINNTTLTIDDFTYSISRDFAYFKEYQTAIVQLGIERDEETRVKREIETHTMEFTTSLEFTRKGYLYVYDIKASNKRSGYSKDREIQLIDRSYQLSDLRVDGLDGKKIILKDTYLGYQRVDSEAEKIKPLVPNENGEYVQEIKDNDLRLGKMWKKPDTNVGYTYYKRKFIFEGTISSGDLQRVELADTSLGDNFSLTEHVALGDKVQLLLLDPPSVYTNPVNQLTIHVENNDSVSKTALAVGPYKKIYEDVVTSTSASGKEKPVTKNRAIFAGKGSLFVVEINQTYPAAGIKFLITDGTSKYNYDENNTFFVQDRNIYAKNPQKSKVWKFAILDEYLESGKFESNTSTLGPKVTDVLVTNDETGATSETTFNFEANEYFSGTDDYINRGLKYSHDGEEYEKLEEDDVVDSIMLSSGTIFFTDSDKVFFQPSEPGTVEFRDHPARSDYADFSGSYDYITIETGDVLDSKKIEECSEAELKAWILTTLKNYFYSLKAEGSTTGSDANSAISNSYKIPKLELQGENNDEVEIDLEFQGPRKLAMLLSGQAEGTNWTISESTIKMPTITVEDIPVYEGSSAKPKWRKSFVFGAATGVTLMAATYNQLKMFVRAINPIRYITRKTPNISTYGESRNKIVAWDQNAAMLTIMDKQGNVIEKVATPYLGYEAGFSYEKNGNTILLKDPIASTISNTLFIKDNKTDAFSTASKTYSIGGKTITGVVGKYVQSEYNYYKLFMKGGDLYLPDLYKSLGSSTKADLQNEKITINGSDFTFENLLKNESEYERYLKYIFAVDYMASAVCPYVTLKNQDCWMSYAKLLSYFGGDNISGELGAKVRSALETVGENAMSDPADICKGVPFITYEQYLKGDCNVLSETSDALISFAINGSVEGYTSLVKDSGIVVSDSFVRVFGTIEWPEMNEGDEDNGTTFLGQIKTRYRTMYAHAFEDVEDPDEFEKFLNEKIQDLRDQLQQNFNRFFPGDLDKYKDEAGGKRTPFVLSLDLDTYRFGPVANDSVASEAEIPNAYISDGENFTAFTTQGSYDAGTGSSMMISPEYEGPSLSKEDGKLLDLIKQMKCYSNNVSVVSEGTVDPKGRIKIGLKGTLADNPVQMFSRVLKVEDKELTLEEFGLMMDSGTTNAILLIEDRNLNNFQLGYGVVTGIENLDIMQTIFKVNKPDYADFVSYENSFSRPDENGERRNVFEDYPSWETVSQERRKYFYNVDGDDPVYMTNNFGQYLLRIDESQLYFGNIYKTGETLAGEKHNFESSLSNPELFWNSYLIGAVETTGVSYENLWRRFPRLQRVPELVKQPLEAIRKYAYSVGSYALSGTNTLKITDYYNEQNLLKKSIELSLNVNEKAYKFIEDAKANSEDVNLVDLDVWIINPTETLPTYRPITDFAVSTVKGADTIIRTNYLNEMIIPEKGYGQALIGEYNTPKDCPFEDGIFFDSTHLTKNSSGETFTLKKLLRDDTGKVTSIVELEKDIPALIYRSFWAADVDLDKELATKEPIDKEFIPFILRLSDYEFDGKTLKFDARNNYPNIYEDNSVKYATLLELFKNNLKFSCRLIWSENTINETALKYDKMSSIGMLDGREIFSQDDLIEKIGYTRIYAENTYPNYSPYLDANDKLHFTSTSFMKNFETRTCDENGNLLGMGVDGNLTRVPGKNGFLFGVKVTSVESEDSSSSKLTSFSYSAGQFDSRIFRTGDFLGVSTKTLKFDYKENRISIGSNPNIYTFFFTEDPSLVDLKFSRIENITETETKVTDGVEIYNTPGKMWEGEAQKWRIKFNDLTMRINYASKFETYNFAYLKDKSGDLIAKVYFENGVTSEDLVIFSNLV